MTTMYLMLRNVHNAGLSAGDVVALDWLDEKGLRTYLERGLAEPLEDWDEARGELLDDEVIVVDEEEQNGEANV